MSRLLRSQRAVSARTRAAREGPGGGFGVSERDSPVDQECVAVHSWLGCL